MMVDSHNNIPSAGTGHTRDKSSSRTAPADSTSQTKTVDRVQNQEKENVQLSHQAKSLHQLEAQIKASDDVDQARVETVRRAIEEGRYQVDSDKIAERLLNQDDQF